MHNIWSAILLFCIISLINGSTYYPWSHLATLSVGEAGKTYGLSKSMLGGRGFINVQTGSSEFEPAIYIHTTDNGLDSLGFSDWTLQAKLTPNPSVPLSAGFGNTVVAFNQTIISAAPFTDVRGFYAAGAVYIFNGTRRHWTQIQRLTALEGGDNSRFGSVMSLNGNLLLVGAPGSVNETGAAYMFSRPYEGALWSRAELLVARELYPSENRSIVVSGGFINLQLQGSLFAKSLAMYEDYCVMSATQDEFNITSNDGNAAHSPPYARTGSAYIFQRYAGTGRWSQQQKLVAPDFEHLEWWTTLDPYAYGDKKFAYDLAITNQSLAVAVQRFDGPEYAQQSVRLYGKSDFNSIVNTPVGTSRWSLQQKLILDCCDEDIYGNPISNSLVQAAQVNFGEDIETLFATMLSPTNKTEFVYAVNGVANIGYKTWSLQQILHPNVEDPGFTERFNNPNQYGGHLLMASNNNSMEVFTNYHNGSCLLLWMSDHFGDGWDSLVLTVRAPDTTNNSFAPLCDQVDPFYVRYCPYSPFDEGVYIVKPFAAQRSRFFWEITWKVQLESTGEWFMGDYNSKYMFFFNSTTLEFSLYDQLNPVTTAVTYTGTNEITPCFRCEAFSLLNWDGLRNIGNASFFSIEVYGGPYYISDVSGRTIYHMGKICDAVDRYECYHILPDGFYIFRLGGGDFGRLLGLPYAGASWVGCGVNGTDRDQLIFQIADQQCTPLQVYNYGSTCSVPPALNLGVEYDSAFDPHVPGSGSRRLTKEDEAYMDINMFLLP